MTHTAPDLAVLPMYDWPEIRAETDALWQAIADGLAAWGIAAPAELDRSLPDTEAWRAPDLLLGQTCGRPYALTLSDTVTLLGRPTYDAPGCGPGRYSSALVVRADDDRRDIAAFRGATAAANGRMSQSGWAALRDMLPDSADADTWFGTVRITGSHRQSVREIAAGDADIAAIDAVAWALAQRHEPAAQGLKALAWSPAYPSLPYITGKARSAEEVERLKDALREAVAGLPPAVRAALMLADVEDASPADYAALKRP